MATITYDLFAHPHRWMEAVAKKQGYDVTFNNVSDDYAVVSVAGPKSRDVMDKLTDTDVSGEAWQFMTQQDVEVAGVQAHGFRLSYTGQLYSCRSGCVCATYLRLSGREEGEVNDTVDLDPWVPY